MRLSKLLEGTGYQGTLREDPEITGDAVLVGSDEPDPGPQDSVEHAP